MSSDSNLPQRIEPAEELDAYERDYMNDGQAVVMRAKTRIDWRAPGVLGGLAVFFIVWCATRAGLGLPLGLGLGVPMMLMGLFFAVLRVRVTTEHVEVQYGMMGPKIPLRSIESVEAIEHGWNSWVRWGVSPVGPGAWLYSVAGDKGRAVKIVWRTKAGRRRVHYIGSAEHRELAAAIEASRGPAMLEE